MRNACPDHDGVLSNDDGAGSVVVPGGKARGQEDGSDLGAWRWLWDPVAFLQDTQSFV